MSDDSTYFYTHDHLGSIRQVTDEDETVVEHYHYDPYGVQTVSASGGPNNTRLADFRYTGHYHHEKSGLHLAMYRAYDAELGVWISEDPIAERGGVNLYGYVHSNPVEYQDLIGLDETPWPLNGRVCNKCPHPILVLVQGQYYTLGPGECSDPEKCYFDKPGQLPYYDVDGVWVDGQFHSVGALGTFHACKNSSPSTPDQRGRPPGDNDMPDGPVEPLSNKLPTYGPWPTAAF